jgi:hypothetical protein
MAVTNYIATGITVAFGTLTGELHGVRYSGEKTDFIDVSHQASANGYKDFKAALTDPGEIILAMSFDPDAVVPATKGVAAALIVTFPSGATKKFSAQAIYGGRGFDGTLGAKMVSDLTFKISGKPNWDYT